VSGGVGAGGSSQVGPAGTELPPDNGTGSTNNETATSNQFAPTIADTTGQTTLAAVAARTEDPNERADEEGQIARWRANDEIEWVDEEPVSDLI